MLHIQLSDHITIDENIIERNVEELFARIILQGTAKEREALKLIEKAEYIDSESIIDRFGYKLRIDNISTGCKAILCVLNMPETWIDTAECGMNALSVLVSLCEEGHVIMYDTGVTFTTLGLNTCINVEIEGKVFHDTMSLNDYIQDGRLLCM